MPDQTSCLAPHNGRVHSQPSERTNTAGKQVSNLILLSISDSDYSSLRPHLEYVSLPNHLVLHEAGGKLEFAHFPNRGLILIRWISDHRISNYRSGYERILGTSSFCLSVFLFNPVPR
jgi:hypothetical protein